MRSSAQHVVSVTFVRSNQGLDSRNGAFLEGERAQRNVIWTTWIEFGEQRINELFFLTEAGEQRHQVNVFGESRVGPNAEWLRLR